MPRAGYVGPCWSVKPEQLRFALQQLHHAVDGRVLPVALRVDGIGPDRVLQCRQFTQLGLDVLLNARPGFAAPIFADGLDISSGLGLRDPGSGRDFGEAEPFKEKGRDFNSPRNDLCVLACFSVICAQMASLEPHRNAEHEPGANT